MTYYCPHHDPLLRAGVVECGKCGCVAFPLDAAWIAETKILAEFPPVCEHASRHVRVVDITRLTPMPADADPGKLTRGRRCAGRTLAGRPCRQYAMVGSDYCHQHAHQRREAR